MMSTLANIGVGSRTAAERLRELIDWDRDWYVQKYPDIAGAIEQGTISDPLHHYLSFGRLENRFPSASSEMRAKQNGKSVCLGDKAQIPLGNHLVPMDWPIKAEAGKTFLLKFASGFFERYMSGDTILDIGFRGADKNAVPIFPHAIGIDIDYPGYDGVHLPFDDDSVDSIFASHILEHVTDAKPVIGDWFRALKIGGFIVCVVPHQFLYERKQEMPSRWSGEHLRFYSPVSLLGEFENSLRPNSYRIRHLCDNDFGYVYDRSVEIHPGVCYEIELVLEKIKPPSWGLA